MVPMASEARGTAGGAIAALDWPTVPALEAGAPTLTGGGRGGTLWAAAAFANSNFSCSCRRSERPLADTSNSLSSVR